jgi:hypothetical protein
MDQNWEGIDGRDFDWSAQWEALVKTPVESEGPFYAECSQEFIIKVADKKLLHIKGDQTTSSSSIDMVKGIWFIRHFYGYQIILYIGSKKDWSHGRQGTLPSSFGACRALVRRRS